MELVDTLALGASVARREGSSPFSPTIYMTISTQPYKGARDFYPEDKRLQKWLFNKWRQVCEIYGYEEYDAPILEPTDLFLIKGNEEIIAEQTYTFEDRGGRSVTVRTEMTPSVSRMVAGKRQELVYPLRWYSVPNLWRYERTQRGRLREFWQLNADIFGIDSVDADAEIIMLSDSIMKSFGAKRRTYEIKISSRKLIDYVLLEYFQFDEVEAVTIRRLIDRMHKMPKGEFVTSLEAVISPSQRESGIADSLVAYLTVTEFSELPTEIASHETARELMHLMARLEKNGISNLKFDPTLMRGFDYYTGIVFEVFDTDPNNNRSMFGGGRYDGLVAQFGADPVSTVGFGMGDVTLLNFLETHGLVPKLKSETELYVAVMEGLNEKTDTIIKDLREMGVKLAVDYSGRKLDKQIKIAVKKGINYLIVLGQKEIESGHFSVKNLETGEENAHSLQRIVSIIKDYRHTGVTE